MVKNDSKKWNHIIYKITGNTPTRRSYVLWSCLNHKEGDIQSCTFVMEDPLLTKLRKKKVMSSTEIDELISAYPGQQFYCSRMDEYLKYYKNPRTVCCRLHQNTTRKKVGYISFQDLLKSRGDHYNTIYTLLIPSNEYNGKHIKYPIRCEKHNETFKYSMQNLNFTTSCSCKCCRVDPNHSNVCVEIIKKRNAGRPGQVIRHASKVKEKYNNRCALSNATFDLQHHHVDGQDFYTSTQLLWEQNGICLCGTIHRDYHFNFLLTYSIIAKEYDQNTLGYTDGLFLDDNNHNNPDFSLAGAEVSRYTFLEYLLFLISDIKNNNSVYVNALNNKITLDSNKTNVSNYSLELESTVVDNRPSNLNLGEITLNQLESAKKQFCAEYKANNWALSGCQDIPYANDSNLWEKVDSSWL